MPVDGWELLRLYSRHAEEARKGVANVLGKDKRINHRFTRVSVQEPEYDEVCMIVRPEERIIFENRAAKPNANVVMILHK